MSPDPNLDALLRDVPLPSGLVARVQGSIGPSDEELDAALRQVMIPVGLVRDLRAIPADESVDQRLNDVAAPFELVRQARRQRWTSRVGRLGWRAAELTVALSLFLCVSAALVGTLVVMIGSVYPDALPAEEPAFIVAANLPLDFESGQSDDGNQSVALMPVSIEISSDDAHAPSTLAVEPPDLSPTTENGPVGLWLASLEQGVRPLDNAVLLRFGIFGYPQFGEEVMPPLESPLPPRSVGIELPSVRGYDRMFVLRRGVFPPVSPAAHPALAEVELPLTTRTDSYEHVQWLLEKHRTPSPTLVRTEDFLAAMPYDFPPARPGELAIRTAAGPSVFGPPGTGLLQVAAIAGELPRSDDDGGHLVLAIDMSQSMARGRRLDLVRQSIDRLLTRMGSNDRLSLVVFDEAVRYVVERATSGDADQLRRLLADLRPTGATDLAEGIQQAAALAMTEDAAQSRPSHLVLVTDSQVAMPPLTQSLVTAVLSIAQESSVRMDVLDVGDHPERDEVLSQWAEMMLGAVHQPTSPADAAWKLTEWMYGQSPVVGAEARLTLKLDPRTVARYRLIGCEGNSLSSLEPVSRQVELRASEVATALLEIWFQANEADDVGTVELLWRDPVTGLTEHRSQRISRLQFAPTWEQAPLSLQQAAIAAETAEVLRGSRTALREVGIVPRGAGDLASVAAAARRVHPRLAEEREFRAWVRMIGELSKLRP